MKKDKNTQTKKRREYNAGRIFGKNFIKTK